MIDGDIISRILDKPSGGSQLEELIDDGIVRIIIEKRDPYYTIAKNKIKECICEVTREVDEDYQSKMIQRLNKLYIKSSGHKAPFYTFYTNFIEICIEFVKDETYPINKDGLEYLNKINREV